MLISNVQLWFLWYKDTLFHNSKLLTRHLTISIDTLRLGSAIATCSGFTPNIYKLLIVNFKPAKYNNTASHLQSNISLLWQYAIVTKWKWHDQIKSYLDKGSLDRISLDQKFVFSVDRKFHFHLIKFFGTFHLIESFNNVFHEMPKNLSLDRIINKTFDQLPKKNGRILALDRKFLN